MDESLAELAVRVRQHDVASGRARGGPGRRGGDQGLRVPRVDALPLARGGRIYLALRSAGRQWELPSWVEYYRLGPADWPDFRAAVREALSDGPLTVAELGEAWRGTARTGT